MLPCGNRVKRIVENKLCFAVENRETDCRNHSSDGAFIQ